MTIVVTASTLSVLGLDLLHLQPSFDDRCKDFRRGDRILLFHARHAASAGVSCSIRHGAASARWAGFPGTTCCFRWSCSRCPSCLRLTAKKTCWKAGNTTRRRWAIYASYFMWLMVLEATRRAGGMPIFVICLVVSLYPALADHAPGFLEGQAESMAVTASFHMFGTESVMGIPMRAFASLVVGFPHFRRGAPVHRRRRPSSSISPLRCWAVFARRACQGGDLFLGPYGLDERLGHHQCADYRRALDPGDEAGRLPPGLCRRRGGLRIHGRRADAACHGRDRLHHGDLP